MMYYVYRCPQCHKVVFLEARTDKVVNCVHEEYSHSGVSGPYKSYKEMVFIGGVEVVVFA